MARNADLSPTAFEAAIEAEVASVRAAHRRS